METQATTGATNRKTLKMQNYTLQYWIGGLMGNLSKLKLECLAIGSLPHNNLQDAMNVVEKYFDIPFWPQFAKISKNEDMIVQFLEGMPSFFIDKENGKVFLDTEYEEFFEDLEQFFTDYEEIISDINSPALDKYAISPLFSAAIPEFLKIIKNKRPGFAKGQIVGPFTLSTTLVDKNGRCAIYDETLKEIIIKTLTIKALWQIREIKHANPDTVPVIFIDEPSISQLGTSAYVTISQQEVIDMFSEVAGIIQNAGALCAIHCCGKCDWRVPIKSGINIINLDAYSFAQNLSLFKADVEGFLKNGGKIAWGVVPTLDKDALEQADEKLLEEKFVAAVKYLTGKGIDEKLVIDNSIITPSCGAGSLPVVLAEKAMMLTRNLSDSLKERYKV